MPTLMPKGLTGHCPKCGRRMKKKKIKVIVRRSPEREIPDTVYVCPGCKGAFVPESIFGVH